MLKVYREIYQFERKKQQIKNIAFTLQHIKIEKKNSCSYKLTNTIEIKKNCCGKKDLEIHGQKHNTLLSLHTLTL